MGARRFTKGATRALMSLYAEIIAIGPFDPIIASALGYPSDLFRNTRTGTPVVAVLFGIAEGTYAGTQFAKCLGITDPWDFNQHKIDSTRVEMDELRALFAGFSDGDDYLKDLERFEVLRQAGFDLYFVPNG